VSGLLDQDTGYFSIHHISTGVAEVHDTIVHHKVIGAVVVGGAVGAAHGSSILYLRNKSLGRETEKIECRGIKKSPQSGGSRGLGLVLVFPFTHVADPEFQRADRPLKDPIAFATAIAVRLNSLDVFTFTFFVARFAHMTDGCVVGSVAWEAVGGITNQAVGHLVLLYSTLEINP